MKNERLSKVAMAWPAVDMARWHKGHTMLPWNLMWRNCSKVYYASKLWNFVSLRVNLNPLKKEIHEILCSKCGDRFSNPFFELVQNTCQVHFSYLLRLGNYCKGPRTLQKFPQKCQKIAGCWGLAVYVRNLWSPRNLAPPLRNDPVQTIPRVNHGLTKRAPCNTASSTLSCLFQQKERDKVEVGWGVLRYYKPWRLCVWIGPKFVRSHWWGPWMMIWYLGYCGPSRKATLVFKKKRRKKPRSHLRPKIMPILRSTNHWKWNTYLVLMPRH